LDIKSINSKRDIIAYFVQLLKFGTVGIVTTLFAIVSYYILLSVLELPIYPVYICVYFVGILISYLLNSNFTFGKSYNKKDSIRYYLIYGVGLIFGLSIIYFVKLLTKIESDLITVIITIVPRFILTFVLLGRFLYND